MSAMSHKVFLCDPSTLRTDEAILKAARISSVPPWRGAASYWDFSLEHSLDGAKGEPAQKGGES